MLPENEDEKTVLISKCRKQFQLARCFIPKLLWVHIRGSPACIGTKASNGRRLPAFCEQQLAARTWLSTVENDEPRSLLQSIFIRSLIWSDTPMQIPIHRPYQLMPCVKAVLRWNSVKPKCLPGADDGERNSWKRGLESVSTEDLVRACLEENHLSIWPASILSTG